MEMRASLCVRTTARSVPTVMQRVLQGGCSEHNCAAVNRIHCRDTIVGYIAGNTIMVQQSTATRRQQQHIRIPTRCCWTGEVCMALHSWQATTANWCVPVGLHAHVNVIVASFLDCKVLACRCLALGAHKGCVLV